MIIDSYDPGTHVDTSNYIVIIVAGSQTTAGTITTTTSSIVTGKSSLNESYYYPADVSDFEEPIPLPIALPWLEKSKIGKIFKYHYPKYFNRRMMFSRSGHLPLRIRKKKMNA